LVDLPAIFVDYLSVLQDLLFARQHGCEQLNRVAFAVQTKLPEKQLLRPRGGEGGDALTT